MSVIDLQAAAARKGRKLGLNISICKKNGDLHPTWDEFRHTGDREVPHVLTDVVGAVRYDDDGCPLHRPYDIDAFVAEMTARHPDGAQRWAEMGAILRDQEWWLDIDG